MKIKSLLAKMLFNKRQRAIIYKALVFSAYKYRQRNNVNMAVAVQTVMNEIGQTLGVVPETFTKEEVDSIVDGVIAKMRDDNHKAYVAGLNDGKRQVIGRIEERQGGDFLAVGTVIDANACKECPHKSDCLISEAIFDVENEEGNTCNCHNDNSQEGDDKPKTEVAETKD